MVDMPWMRNGERAKRRDGDSGYGGREQARPLRKSGISQIVLERDSSKSLIREKDNALQPGSTFRLLALGLRSVR
jgi:hypothetical protein